MSGVRIVKLAPGSSVNRVATFEEAFGEFSQARGKGRARRSARKSDRTAKKTQKKLEKIASKDEVKRAKKEGRIARRSDRKSLRKGSRQERRTDQMQARQDRRLGRKDMRLQRKRLGQEPELEMDEQTMAETDNGYQDQGGQVGASDQYQDQGSGDQGSYSDQGLSQEGDSQPQGYGNGEGEYQTTQDGDYDEAEEGYDDEGYGDEGDGDYDESDEESEYDDAEQADYEDDAFEDEFESFDGVMGAEDRFSETTDAKDPNKKVVKVDVNVQGVADKIRWNRELVERLRAQKAIAMGENKSTQAIENQINERLDRIAMLQNVLQKYTSFEGEFSSADGTFASKPFRKVPASQINARKREVAKATAIANKKLDRAKANRRSAQAVAVAQRNARRKGFGGDVTPVEAELDPKFSEQRIVVEAQSNATGTGLNGIDQVEDFDAPPVRTFEITSNADGPGRSIPWGGILIGAAIGIGAILLIKKYKVFGK